MRSCPNKLGFEAAGGFKILLHLKPGDRLQQVAAHLATLAASLPEPFAAVPAPPRP